MYPSEAIKIEHHNDYAIAHYPKRIKNFKNAPLQTGDIVLLGNSITEGGNDWRKKLDCPKVKNRGISGDITKGVLMRLDEIHFYKPKQVFILIGINDLMNYKFNGGIPSVEYIENNIIEICKLIHKNSPQTIIYLQTILPTAEIELIDAINHVNKTLKQNEDLGFYKIIDLYSKFINEQNLLKETLTYDGLHLNDAGYAIWVDVLKSYLSCH